MDNLERRRRNREALAVLMTLATIVPAAILIPDRTMNWLGRVSFGLVAWRAFSHLTGRFLAPGAEGEDA